ncbi:MAG: ATP phosphoribosyltransferase regulatory subunit [Hyphomicrobiales bacterium]|nr:ATP phosphoribosyltransferase regulatory subunit [Hyphomicrobiales bacterium]
MRRDRLRQLIEEKGYTLVEPPVLHPADLFLDVAGEDLRKRLFVTQGPDGSEWCLRPDYTIPVCRHYLETVPGTVADYGYIGPVFRHRPSGSAEFLQAGIESLGREDREEADADVLAFALEASAALGVTAAEVRLGDSALVAAFVEALELPAIWRARLRRMFGDPTRLAAGLDRLAGGDGGIEGLAGHTGFLAALEGADPEAARAAVEDILSIAGISMVGGRTPHEIADRFLEQAALSAGSGLGDEKIAHLRAFLDISGQPRPAVLKMEEFAESVGVDLSAPLSAFARRLDVLESHGLNLDKVMFATEFGRRLDYYTGFVFELYDPADPARGHLAGGGRYDGLVEHLGAERTVPAVGCAFWLDRYPAGGGQ